MAATVQRPFRQRRFRRWLWLIAAAALAVRLVVGFELYARHAAVRHPGAQTDMYTYRDYARQLLAGEYDWSRGFYYQPFYYSVFLPPAYLAGDAGGAVVVVLQALLGAAAVALTGLTFARLFGRAAGLLGAGLLAVSRMHIFYTPYLLMAVLQSFWMALFAWLAVLAWTRRRWWCWALAALVLAAGTLTRGNLVFFLPLLLALLVWRHRCDWRRAAAFGALAFACFYAPQLPFALVNYRIHGKWTGPSSAGGAVLALGNTPEAPPGGREPWTGAGPMEYPEASRAWVSSENAGGPSVAANMLAWARREPLAYTELKFRMLLLFWNRIEVPNNVAERWRDPATGHWRRAPSAVLALPVWPGFLLLGGLGLTGLFWGCFRRRRDPLMGFSAALVLVYSGSIVLFYVLARFRLPVLPLLCGFGGVALVSLAREWRRYRRATGPRKPRGLPALALLLVLAFTFVGYGYDAYRNGYEAAVMRLVRPHGTRIAYADRWTVKDHGPWSFGGWHQLENRAPGAVRKAFVIPEEAAAWPARLRLPLGFGAGRAVLLVAAGAGPEQRHELVWQAATPTEPHTWPSVALPPGTTVVTLTLREAAPGVDFWFDAQRQYRRTALAAGPSPGELVAELILEHPEAEHAD